MDDRLQVGRLVGGLSPGAAPLAKIRRHPIDGPIVFVRDDRRRPIALYKSNQLHTNERGFKSRPNDYVPVNQFQVAYNSALFAGIPAALVAVRPADQDRPEQRAWEMDLPELSRPA